MSDIKTRIGQTDVRLIEDRAYRAAYTLRIDGTDQSYVDLDDPTRLEFEYVQRIAAAIDAQAPDGQRLRVIHIGGAAMTLPRYVAATRPQSAQIVLEPAAELTALIREHLPLPKRSGIKVRAIDGRAGVSELRAGLADVVVLDAFVGSRVPAELTTTEFLSELHQILAPTGTVMINVTDRAPLAYTRRVAAGVRSLFADVTLSAEPATLKGRRFGNVVILGSRGRLAHEVLARRAAGAVFPYRTVEEARLDQFIGSSQPFTAEDSQMSPPALFGAGVFH